MTSAFGLASLVILCLLVVVLPEAINVHYIPTRRQREFGLCPTYELIMLYNVILV
jgi:hypothetical protein